MNQVPTPTPAQTMAELTFGSLPKLVTDEAFEGLCEAYFRTGNKLLYVLADQLIQAENNYASNMRMRQQGVDVPASHEGLPTSRQVEDQGR